MPYNNPYGYNYPTMYQPNTQQQMPQPVSMPSYGYQPNPGQLGSQMTQYYNTNTSEPTWVQGMSGAMAFNMPRGSSPAMLMDSTTNRFYIKSVDPYTGRPLPLEVYEYNKVENENLQNGGISGATPSVDMSQYVPKSEFDTLKGELDSVKTMLEDLTSPGNKKK